MDINTQTATTINEFGTPSSEANGLPAAPLNQQGKEPTLDDVLRKLDARLGNPTDKTPATPAVDEKPDAVQSDDPLTQADIDTGSKALDIAVGSFLKSTSASQEDVRRAVDNAIAYGDAELIDKAFLKERFGDRADEAFAIAEAVVEQAAVKRDALVRDVHALAGNKDAWDQALAVYKQHAKPGLQKVVKAMFDSNDADAVKEAAGLILDFAKNSGVMVQSGNLTVGTAHAAAAQGLSAAEFQAALKELNPNGRNYRNDYDRLIQLRRIGKQAGK